MLFYGHAAPGYGLCLDNFLQPVLNIYNYKPRNPETPNPELAPESRIPNKKNPNQERRILVRVKTPKSFSWLYLLTTTQQPRYFLFLPSFFLFSLSSINLFLSSFFIYSFVLLSEPITSTYLSNHSSVFISHLL